MLHKAVLVGAVIAAAVLVPATAAYTAGDGAQPMVNPPDVPAVAAGDAPHDASQLGPDERRPEEIDPRTAEVTFSEDLNSTERVTIARGRNSNGERRVLFSLMRWEPDMQRWYAAEAWDRPLGGEGTWATFSTSDDRAALLWDGVSPGRTLVVDGKKRVPVSAERGRAALDNVPNEVTIQ